MVGRLHGGVRSRREGKSISAHRSSLFLLLRSLPPADAAPHGEPGTGREAPFRVRAECTGERADTQWSPRASRLSISALQGARADRRCLVVVEKYDHCLTSGGPPGLRMLQTLGQRLV